MLNFTKQEKVGMSIMFLICVVIISITILNKKYDDSNVFDSSFTNNPVIVQDTQTVIKDRISSLGYRLEYTYVRDNSMLGKKPTHSFCSVFNTDEDIVELCYAKNKHYSTNK